MIREYADEPIVFAAFQQHQQECKIGKNPCKASNVFELVQNSALARFDGETIRITLSVACPVADDQQGLSVAALRARLTKVRLFSVSVPLLCFNSDIRQAKDHVKSLHELLSEKGTVLDPHTKKCIESAIVQHIMSLPVVRLFSNFIHSHS